MDEYGAVQTHIRTARSTDAEARRASRTIESDQLITGRRSVLVQRHGAKCRQKNEHFKSIEDLREAGATLLIAARLSRPIGLL
jgi:hemin uptake protein HemP